MYVRQARKRDEAWLLEQFDNHGIDDARFRSRDYVIAVNTDGGDECGFGRINVHKDDEERVAEFSNIVVFDGNDDGRVRSRIVKTLFQKAREADCAEAFVTESNYSGESFEFDAAEPGTDLFSDDGDEQVFSANVNAALGFKTEEEKLADLADEFGYDDDTTTKYSIN